MSFYLVLVYIEFKNYLTYTQMGVTFVSVKNIKLLGPTPL